MKSFRHFKVNNLSDFEDASNRLEKKMKAIFNRKGLEDIQRRCLDLGESKSRDYGAVGDAIAMGGVRGVVVRNLDKQLRCMSLTEPDHDLAIKSESLKDTLMDMINYTTYAVALLEGTWGKQEPPDDVDFHVVDNNDQAHRAIRACELGAKFLDAFQPIDPASEVAKKIQDAAIPDLPF